MKGLSNNMLEEAIPQSKTNLLVTFIHRHKYLSVFILGTLMYILAVLPSIIMRGGLFYYYGDYNMNYIQGAMLTQRSLREGYIFWNPMIDWGSSLFNSFGASSGGFATSLFMYLLLPFPTEWVPYLLPFVMALRYGTAALTAFVWLRSFTKTDNAALIGALLYAFSGFQSINVVFGIFHDTTAFFPLFLLTFDRLMQKKGRIGFVIMTAIMAFQSLFFFYGQVIFLLIYFFVRYFRPREKWLPFRSEAERARRKRNLKLFFTALLYGSIGVAITGFFLIDSISGLLGMSRVSNTVSGASIFAYGNGTTVWEIIKNMFFIPEQMGCQKLFNNSEIGWASVSLYLPCVSISGVIAYFFFKKGQLKKDWRGKLAIILLVMSLVSVLNAAFSAFNSNYYARWFYILILVFCLLSAIAFENNEERGMKVGTKIVIVFSVIFSAVMIFSDNYYIYIIAISLLNVLFLFYLVFGNRKVENGKRFINIEATVIIAILCCISTGSVLFAGSNIFPNEIAKHFEEHAVKDPPKLDMNEFGRIEGTDFNNWTFAWNYPTTEDFVTTVTPSIFDVFENFQFGRTQVSTIYAKNAGLRQLLSTKYYVEGFVNAETEEPAIIPLKVLGIEKPESSSESASLSSISSGNSGSSFSGSEKKSFELFKDDGRDGIPAQFEKIGRMSELDIYENRHFIPMGFTFEHYILEEDIKKLKKDGIDNAFDGNTLNLGETEEEDPVWLATRLLVKDIVLNEDQAERYKDILKYDDDAHDKPMSEVDFCAECDKRAETSCTSFSYDRDGYFAETTLDRDNLVFFSIPWDKGFTAYVDGEKTEIEKVDFGFIAVPVKAGTHTIRLYFRPYYMNVGIAVSLAGMLALILTIIFGRKKKSAKKR